MDEVFDISDNIYAYEDAYTMSVKNKNLTVD